MIITDEVDIVGNPVNIRVMHDDIIALRRVRSEIPVVLYDSRNGKSAIGVRSGEGPDEILSLIDIASDSVGTLWAMGSRDSKVLSISWDGTDSDIQRELMFHGDLHFLKGVYGGNDEIYVLPSFESNIRVAKLDKDEKIINTLGTFPDIKVSNDSLPLTNSMLQSDIAISPDYKKLAVVSKSIANIQILDTDSSEGLTLSGPLTTDIEIIETATPNGVYFAQQPLWFMFDGISAGNDSFFVGYVGVKPENDEDFEKGINSILEFDWLGKPLRRIVFEDDIVAFDVDFDNNYLYTIENTPDPTVYRYNLK